MKVEVLENVIEIVDEINERIIDSFDLHESGGDGNLGLYPRLSLEYITMFGWMIKFGETVLWNEDEEEREWVEEEKNYEPLKPFLLKKVSQYLDVYKKIKVGKGKYEYRR
jgi:hypothetical protein